MAENSQIRPDHEAFWMLRNGTGVSFQDTLSQFCAIADREAVS
ncbi:hypothetical protein [Roseibium sp.]